MIKREWPENVFKIMKFVRRDILKLIQNYLNKETNFDRFNNMMLPPLESLINDYNSSQFEARDPEVLMLFSILIKKIGDYLAPSLLPIVNGLCDSTVLMI